LICFLNNQVRARRADQFLIGTKRTKIQQMVQALLVLMLEVVTTDLVSPSA
jgi:hypothetical protein